MQRIDTRNRGVDMFGPGKDGFMQAVPGVSEPTYLSAKFFNALQESIVRLIEAAGLVPADDHDQLTQAVNLLLGGISSSLAAAGGAGRVGYLSPIMGGVLRDMGVIVDAMPLVIEMLGANGHGDDSAIFAAASLLGIPVECHGTYTLNALPDAMDWRKFSGRGVASIHGHAFQFSYVQRPRHSFDEIRGMIAYSQVSGGTTVNLLFVGDSVVDGANTPGMTENPVDASGNAIGTTNHNDSAPGAFPNRLLALFQEAASDVGYTNRVGVWNAGYSGRSIATGWANVNYERAVILNPHYGQPHMVGIEFAINDSHTGPLAGPIDPAIFVAELGKLVAKIQGYGGTPVMLTPPEIFAISGYDSRTIRSIYDQVKVGFAEQNSLAVLDMGRAVADWFNINADVNAGADVPLSSGVRTASQMYQMATYGLADRTHPGPRTHRFMAAWLFSQLAPNILTASRARRETIPPTDYRWRFRVIDAGSGTAVQKTHLSQQGGRIYAQPFFYNPGEPWNVAWIWNDQPDAFLVYRAGDTNGDVAGQPFVALPHACKMQVEDKTSGNLLYDELVPNDRVAPLAGRESIDRPHVICQLAYGLNFVRLFSPLTNQYSFYPGSLQIQSGLTWAYGSDTWSDFIASGNLLGECGNIYKSQASGVRTYGTKESVTGANWVAFGRTGKLTTLFLDVQMDGVCCLGITSGAGLAQRRVNGALYRDNDTQIKLVLFTEGFNGDVNIALMATFAYAKTGMQRIRMELRRDNDRQTIILFDGWGTTAVLIGQWISNNNAAATICWPWVGHFGDHFLNGPATLECKTALMTCS